MPYLIFGFVFGLFVPCWARRFGKFMPATAAYAVLELVKIRKIFFDRRGLAKALLWRSLMFGSACGGLCWLAGNWWLAGFVCVLLLLAETDYRTLFLPDVLTVPLLIAGFAFSAFSGVIPPEQSAAGAVAGFGIPLVAGLFVVRRHKEAFGGGDVKLLAAVGAWLGLEPVVYVILGACAIFGLWALAARKRAGAFGPAICISAISVAFWIFRI